MELSMAQAIPNLTCLNKNLSTVRSKSSLSPRRPLNSISIRRVACFRSTLLRAIPEGTTNGENQYVDEETKSSVILEDVTPEKKHNYKETVLPQVLNLGDTSVNGETQTFEFLDNMNLDFTDSYSIALYCVGGLAALYLTSAVVGAIDTIPLFPKVMEVVGFYYSLWFSYRYLLYKENRDELAAKIEELKQQVNGGSKD